MGRAAKLRRVLCISHLEKTTRVSALSEVPRDSGRRRCRPKSSPATGERALGPARPRAVPAARRSPLFGGGDAG